MKNIAIDGPAGAGKSTIAKLVAKNLGYIYVDTGAMYRCIALACLRKGIDITDELAVCNVCDDVEVTITYENKVQIVLLDGENVNEYIRTEEVGNTTSTIAVYARVREKLVELQRILAGKENVVMDGRDIGSYVLPEADTKIYLTASARVRAERRCLELHNRGEYADAVEVEKDIMERDYRDMNREISPLKQAEDAVLIDSSNMTIDEVVLKIMEIAHGS